MYCYFINKAQMMCWGFVAYQQWVDIMMMITISAISQHTGVERVKNERT
jgi:hypothetical protein